MRQWTLPSLGQQALILSLLAGMASADCVDVTGETDEGTPVGTFIKNISATYLEVIDGQNLLKAVKLESHLWGLKLLVPLDLEKQTDKSPRISLSCANDTNVTPTMPPTPVDFFWTINDVNEFPPTFPVTSFNISIPENTPISAQVFAFKEQHAAKDLDDRKDTLSYSLEDGADGYFKMSETGGYHIEVIKSPDYEKGPIKFTLNISATESSTDEKLSSFVPLVINIEDVDDMNPVFSCTSYNLTLPEGKYGGIQYFQTVPALSASDGDVTLQQEVGYTIDPSTRADLRKVFSVAQNGSLQVQGLLDVGTYHLNVKAFQTDKPNLRIAVASVTVTVTDVNNHKPVLDHSFYSVNISEITRINTEILSVSAHDDDKGNSSKFQFGLMYTHSNDTGVFGIIDDGDRGIITLFRPLDREANSIYRFQVYAEENLSKERFRSDPSNVTIFITDANDNSPVFTQAEYTFTLNRTAVKGDEVGKVLATDKDIQENGMVDYTIYFPFPSKLVELSTQKGVITLKRNLSPSDVGTHTLYVQAQDRSIALLERRSMIARVTIVVEAVNRDAPMFLSSSYVFNVKEATPPDTQIGTIEVKDIDGDQVTLSLTGGDDGYFKLDFSNPWKLSTTAKVIDLDVVAHPPLTMVLKVQANDGLHVSKVNVTVKLLYKNEFRPSISGTNIVSILENATVNHVVTQVMATDKDRGADGLLQYSLLPTAGSSLFAINSITGRITLNCSHCLDFNTIQRYDLVVKVADGGKPPLTSLSTVAIKVIETELSKPVFAKKIFRVDIAENEAPQFLLQLGATDPDTPEDLLTYSAATRQSQASASSLLQVFPNGSVYSLQEFDAEQVTEIYLDVNVSDGHGTDTAVVIVSITDVNDETPLFTISKKLVTVPENAKIGDVITTISATDSDVTNGNGFFFWLGDGADGKFHLNTTSGILTVAGQFDRSLKMDYNITIYVSDHGQPPRMATSFLGVKVVDSNSAPQFVDENFTAASSYNFTVAEDLKVGELVGVLHASDPDHGSSGVLSFSIVSGNSEGVFSLDEISGNITLVKPLNFEKKKEYFVTVQVKDASFTPKSATAIVVVSVTNVVEAPQWPLPLPTVYLTQSAKCKSSQLQAFSKELATLSSQGDENVEYKLFNMTTNFKINKTSGLLTSTKKLQIGSYVVGISACSGGTNVCSHAALTVVVHADDLLAFCPAFKTVRVNESVAEGEIILDLNTNKGDKDITYAITNGNDDQAFDINKINGTLYVNSTLDRETTDRYTLLITAVGNSKQMSAEAQVIVIVTDVPDTPPLFALSQYHGQVLESPGPSPNVFKAGSSDPLKVLATDPDENSQIVYTIDPSSDDSNGTFQVDSNGVVSTVRAIDFETMPPSYNHIFTFSILASDGIYTSKTNVTVAVLDDNDNSPEFLNAPTSVNVSEFEELPHDLITVCATDADLLDQGKLRYTLDVVKPNGKNSPFTINSGGDIRLQRNLDRETQPEYVLRITANDTDNHSASTNLTVIVTDVNDNTPNFTQLIYIWNVTEGPGGVGCFLPIEAIDKDLGQNANLSYTITEGNAENSFEINTTDTQVTLTTVKALDRETQPEITSEITLVIVAEDHGNPPLKGSCEVLITVLDTNDNPPVFTHTDHYRGSVSEDANNNTLVKLDPSLEVSDKDGPGYGKESVRFSLAKDANVPFVIDPVSGQLNVLYKTLEDHLDREKHDSYIFQVVAADDFGMGYNASTQVIVNVTDVNDEAPRFTSDEFYFTVQEDVIPGTSIGRVQAIDPDSNEATIVYSRTNGQDTFHIDQIEGTIILFATLDRENTSMYYLNISASDGINVGFTRVVINITDTNDNCPVWDRSQLMFQVSEHQAAGYELGHLNASDSDLGDNGSVVFFSNSTAWDNYFQVNSSGNVSLKKNLEPDSLNVTTISFLVNASDEGNPPCVTPATVSITILKDNDYDPEICYKQRCPVSEINFTIFDKAVEGSVIGQIESRDNDTGKDGNVTYSIESWNASIASLFIINEAGILRLNQTLSLNRLKAQNLLEITTEQKNTIKVLLKATDDGTPPRSSNATILFFVDTATSDIPKFSHQTYEFHSSETVGSGGRVGGVQAVSTSGEEIEYSVSTDSGRNQLPVEINPTSGDLITTKELDRETTPTYQFLVLARVKDMPASISRALVIVTVLDENDNDPVCSNNLTVSVNENIIVSQLARVSAEDKDEGVNGTVTFHLVNPALSPPFSLNETTGVLSLLQALDRENVSDYDIGIQAKDGGNPSRSCNISVHVTVTDTNDNPPEFCQTSYTANLIVNTSDHEVLTVHAEDADSGNNARILYYLEPSSDSIFFTINSTSGEICHRQELEKTWYNLTVIATDLGTPQLSDSAIVIINNSRVSNITPSLTLSPTVATIFVGMTPGTELNVTVIAKNASGIAITDGNDEDLFEMTATNKILLKKCLQTDHVYSLTITATSETRTPVSKQLEVRVLPLLFDQPDYIVKTKENTPAPCDILDMGSYAEEQGLSLVYALETPTDKFSIDGATGMLTVIQSLDREESDVHQLNVSVAINASQSTCTRERGTAGGTAQVMVVVEDVNDNSPTFGDIGALLHLTVLRNAKSSHLVYQLQAYDPDHDSRKAIRYRIVQGDNTTFSLDATTGKLTVASPEGLKGHPKKTLVVLATDEFGKGRSTNLTINILIEDTEYRLVASISLPKFRANQDKIYAKLSDILGYHLIWGNVSAIARIKGDGIDRLSIMFAAEYTGTHTSVPLPELQQRVAEKQVEITALFAMYREVKISNSNDDDDMAVPSVALVSVAGALFIISLIAIIIVYALWKRQRQYRKDAEKALEESQKHETLTMRKEVKDTQSDRAEPLEMITIPRVVVPVEVEEQERTIDFSNEKKDAISTLALREAALSHSNIFSIFQPSPIQQSLDSGIAEYGSDRSCEGSPVLNDPSDPRRRTRSEPPSPTPGPGEEGEETGNLGVNVSSEHRGGNERADAAEGVLVVEPGPAPIDAVDHEADRGASMLQDSDLDYLADRYSTTSELPTQQRDSPTQPGLHRGLNSSPNSYEPNYANLGQAKESTLLSVTEPSEEYPSRDGSKSNRNTVMQYSDEDDYIYSLPNKPLGGKGPSHSPTSCVTDSITDVQGIPATYEDSENITPHPICGDVTAISTAPSSLYLLLDEDNINLTEDVTYL